MKHIAIIIFLVLFSQGCKTKKEYIYRDHIIDNTEISHTQEVIFKGGKSVTIIPCREIDQVIELGDTKVKLTSVPQTEADPTYGSMKVEIIQPQDTITSTNTEITSKEIIDERIKEIVYERYIPKLMWYLLIASLLLNIWAYRTQILVLIRKLLIKV